MKRDIILAGVLGLVIAACIFLGANLVKGYIPWIASSLIASIIVFIIVLFIAIVEMPIMAFGLRKMASSPTVPRVLIAGGFLVYVIFAAVYAAIYVLVTGDQYFYLGTALAALGLVRFATGIFIR